MEVFDASTLPRPGVRYGTVVRQSAQPRFRSMLAEGLDPAAQVTHAVYGGLYRLIASTTPRELPELTSQQARALRSAYGATSPAGANDGVVPTRSQTWGEVIHAALADHLDGIGHFRDAASDPPHVDWLVTGSGFNRCRFELLWDEVARFVSADAQKQPSPRAARRSQAGAVATS